MFFCEVRNLCKKHEVCRGHNINGAFNNNHKCNKCAESELYKHAHLSVCLSVCLSSVRASRSSLRGIIQGLGDLWLLKLEILDGQLETVVGLLRAVQSHPVFWEVGG